MEEQLYYSTDELYISPPVPAGGVCGSVPPREEPRAAAAELQASPGAAGGAVDPLEVLLVLVGVVRGPADQRRVDALQDLAPELEIDRQVSSAGSAFDCSHLSGCA